MSGPNDKIKEGPTEPDPGYEGADMSASKLEDTLNNLKCDLEELEITLAKTEKEKQV